ncbi:hypothetical protein FTO70_03850 [Methanosarcina sp. KYL-1]|uniref:hypothetical protein n=1 Tax=Methanosarcina sp. KYL-1 TaxID=2602068 RepID=UPI00210089CC|nr:hypothetical protein [Methanosarcina sp. KYL-1]MCQ1534837.1 hypothetical protein [Methanosarcina sp. KYL-1]
MITIISLAIFGIFACIGTLYYTTDKLDSCYKRGLEGLAALQGNTKGYLNLTAFVPGMKSSRAIRRKNMVAMDRFKKNEKAYMAGNAIGILVLLVTLMLCALLFGTLQGQTDGKIAALNDSQATTSYGNIKTTGWGAIDLYGMVPYVAVFIVILGMLMGLAKNA